MLEQNSFEVDTFTDPRKALANFRPDIRELLILDISMRDMTGIRSRSLCDCSKRSVTLNHFFEHIERAACLSQGQFLKRYDDCFGICDPPDLYEKSKSSRNLYKPREYQSPADAVLLS
jgi:hypothetical protein